MLNKNSFFTYGGVEGVVYEGYFVPRVYKDANYSYDLIGYKEGVAGEISENLNSIFLLSMPANATDSIRLGIRLFNGKPERDGNIAHVFKCEISTDISATKRCFLIPSTGPARIADGDSRYVFPGDYYTVIDEIPDALVTEDKNGNVLETFPLSFPQSRVVSNVKNAVMAYMAKDGVYIMNFGSIECHNRLPKGVKCNISIRITPLTGGGI